MPLWLRLDDLDLAELVERRRRGLGQRIVDVLQLPDLLDTPEFASPTLVWAAVRDHVRELERVDLESLVDARRNTRGSALLVYLLAVPLVFAFSWPRTADIWARRWLLGQNVRWPADNLSGARRTGRTQSAAHCRAAKDSSCSSTRSRGLSGSTRAGN